MGFINGARTWEQIKDKPKTLAGYGITDAYVKSQVDTSVNTKLSYDNVGGGIRVIRDAAQYNSNSVVTGTIKITIPANNR